MLERFDVSIPSGNPVFNDFRRDHLECYQIASQIVGKTGLILDAASGMGHGYDALGSLGQYIGLEISGNAIDAALKSNPRACYDLADLNEPNCFAIYKPDAIVSIYTAEHLRYPRRFLSDAYRSLPVGGRFVLAVPTGLSRDFDPYHLHDWSAERWQRAVQEAGFTVYYRRFMKVGGSFVDFRQMIETTWGQWFRVMGFLGWHPRYLADRLWNWILRGRFELTSCLWGCRKLT